MKRERNKQNKKSDKIDKIVFKFANKFAVKYKYQQNFPKSTNYSGSLINLNN